MIDLYRTYPKHNRWVTGRYEVAGVEFLTLERPWLDNKPFHSCIPEGIYRFHRDNTGKHRYYRIVAEDVAPRTDIEIHPVKLVRHLQGCIAPCMGFSGGSDGKEIVALESLFACEKMIELFGDDGFAMRIQEDKN